MSHASLPELTGRLVWPYRLVWCALAIGAVAASGVAALQYESHPAIVGLRLAKNAVLLGVAVILLRRRQRDTVAGLLALAFLTWTITSGYDLATHVEVVQLLDRCRFLLFALALLIFPDGRWKPRWTRVVAWSSAAVFLIGIAEVSGMIPTHIFLPLAIPCVLAGIGSLIVRFRTSTNYALKQQLKWVALGLIIGIGLILFARAASALSIARVPAMPILWEAIFQLGIMVIALGFLVSLLRYRLFDAETVISRSAAYAGLTISMVATFGGTEAAIQNLGQDYLGMNFGSISGAMAAAVAAVLLSPLHHRITEWAESRFQPDLALLKRQMPELIASLSTNSSTRRLCAEVLPPINAAIHATRSALLCRGRIVASCGIADQDSRRWVQGHDIGNLREREPTDPTFPVRLRFPSAASRRVEWLLLGPRPDGTLYGQEDLDAVRFIIPSLQQALASTSVRESIDAAVARSENNLASQIADVRAQLRAHQLLIETASSPIRCSCLSASQPRSKSK